MQFELELAPAAPPSGRVPSGCRRRMRRGAGRPDAWGVRRLRAADAVTLSGCLAEIARLAAPGGWITWVAPPFVPTPAACRRHAMSVRQHRLVFPARGGGRGRQRLLERALEAGTSRLVLAWLEPGETVDEAALARLARRHRCHVYLFEATR